MIDSLYYGDNTMKATQLLHDLGQSLRNGFLDALRGSHSEQVLRRTPCPLLAIPVEAAVTPRLSATQE